MELLGFFDETAKPFNFLLQIHFHFSPLVFLTIRTRTAVSADSTGGLTACARPLSMLAE
jgi:hypothetical protein